MSTIVTRTSKGSALTHLEMDNNLNNLNSDKAGLSGGNSFSGNQSITGGTFASRGITDSATAKALTLSGAGANSVTIANSATNPTIGTSAGRLDCTSGFSVSGGVGSSSDVSTTRVQAWTSAGNPGVTLVRSTNAANARALELLNQAGGAGNLRFISDDYLTAGIIINWSGDSSRVASTNLCYVAGVPTVSISSVVGQDRFLTLTGANGGNPTIGTSAGDLLLSPGGGAVVSFGTYSAKAAEAFAGYITIKDAAGNSRKVMVCA